MPKKDIRPLIRQFKKGEIINAQEAWDNEIYRGILVREGFDYSDLEDEWGNVSGIDDLSILTISLEDTDHIPTRNFDLHRSYKKGEIITIRNNQYEITHAFLAEKDFTAFEDMESHVAAGDMVPVGLPEVPYAGKVFFDHPEFNTVKDALTSILYTVPTVDLTCDVHIVEKGKTIDVIEFEWETDEDGIKSQHISGIGFLPSLNSRSYTANNLGLTEDTTFTITITNNGGHFAIDSVDVIFQDRIFWGLSENDSLNSIPNDFDSKLVDNINHKEDFDCSGGRYIYFITPKDFGDASKFLASGTDAPFYKTDTINHTNQFGYGTKYNIYRSAEKQHGSSIVTEIR